MDTDNDHYEIDDRRNAQRDIIRESLDEIANDIGMAMRDVGLTFPVYMTVRNSGDALVTIATTLDPSSADWQQASEIVCRILEEKVGCGQLRGQVLHCAIANAGIGAAIAKALAAEGAAVVVNYAASRRDAETVVAEITGKGGKAVVIQGDVSKSRDVERLFADTSGASGRIDILVNNAGVYRFAPIETVTEDDFHQHFNINVLGVVLAVKEAVRHFGPDGGSIINLSTAVTRNPPPGFPCMSPPKSAIEAITRVLAKELGPRKDCGVNAISPGEVETRGNSIGWYRG